MTTQAAADQVDIFRLLSTTETKQILKEKKLNVENKFREFNLIYDAGYTGDSGLHHEYLKDLSLDLDSQTLSVENFIVLSDVGERELGDMISHEDADGRLLYNKLLQRKIIGRRTYKNCKISFINSGISYQALVKARLWLYGRSLLVCKGLKSDFKDLDTGNIMRNIPRFAGYENSNKVFVFDISFIENLKNRTVDLAEKHPSIYRDLPLERRIYEYHKGIGISIKFIEIEMELSSLYEKTFLENCELDELEEGLSCKQFQKINKRMFNAYFNAAKKQIEKYAGELEIDNTEQEIVFKQSWKIQNDHNPFAYDQVPLENK